MEINLQLKDRVALMKRLDLNKDGKITEDELYKVLSGSGGSSGDSSVINQTLIKIAGGAPDATNLRQYARDLIRRFDTNSDGVVSPSELFEGLRDMNIYLSPKEREALLRKLDID
jgi:Ca2+-binding EF-hand superfamily protein